MEKSCESCRDGHGEDCIDCIDYCNWQPKEEGVKNCTTCGQSGNYDCSNNCIRYDKWKPKLQGKEIDEVLVDDMPQTGMSLAEAFAALVEGKRVRHNGAEATLNGSNQMIWINGASSVAVCTITQDGWTVIEPEPEQPEYIDCEIRKYAGLLVYGEGADMAQAPNNPNFIGYVYEVRGKWVNPRPIMYDWHEEPKTFQPEHREGCKAVRPIAVRFSTKA